MHSRAPVISKRPSLLIGNHYDDGFKGPLLVKLKRGGGSASSNSGGHGRRGHKSGRGYAVIQKKLVEQAMLRGWLNGVKL